MAALQPSTLVEEIPDWLALLSEKRISLRMLLAEGLPINPWSPSG
ncbi:hypothetical protein [Spirosoma pulveris]